MDLWTFPHQKVVQDTSRDVFLYLPFEEHISLGTSGHVNQSPRSNKAHKERKERDDNDLQGHDNKYHVGNMLSVPVSSRTRRKSFSVNEIEETLHYISTKEIHELQTSWSIIRQLLGEVKNKTVQQQVLEMKCQQLQEEVNKLLCLLKTCQDSASKESYDMKNSISRQGRRNSDSHFIHASQNNMNHLSEACQMKKNKKHKKHHKQKHLKDHSSNYSKSNNLQDNAKTKENHSMKPTSPETPSLSAVTSLHHSSGSKPLSSTKKRSTIHPSSRFSAIANNTNILISKLFHKQNCNHDCESIPAVGMHERESNDPRDVGLMSFETETDEDQLINEDIKLLMQHLKEYRIDNATTSNQIPINTNASTSSTPLVIPPTCDSSSGDHHQYETEKKFERNCKEKAKKILEKQQEYKQDPDFSSQHDVVRFFRKHHKSLSLDHGIIHESSQHQDSESHLYKLFFY